MDQLLSEKIELIYHYFTRYYSDAYLLFLAQHFAESGDYDAAIRAIQAFRHKREFYDVELDMLNDIHEQLAWSRPCQPTSTDDVPEGEAA